MQKEWFAAWFDSPYYHILYKKRDEEEARKTLDNLLSALHLPPGARILDLACGKGRHARYLAERGFDVTGLDISLSSIAYAAQFEHERLSFFQHDMRLPFRINYFDAVVNFFTSFGYFDNDEDHLRSLKNVSKGLRPKGLLLLDYFNSNWVLQHLQPSETKTIDGINFQLRKWVSDGHVFKQVDFVKDGQAYHFQERVRLFDLNDFRMMFEQSGLQLKAVFGSYQLEAFDPQSSQRLILIAEK